MSGDALIRVKGLTRDYDMGSETVRALRGVDLTIRRNEYVAIMGPSGSGKSTLMNLLGCLDTPTSGEYWLNGTEVSRMADDELARVRNREIGFVFQTFNLLPRASALHNVELPLIYAGLRAKDRRARAARALERVGLADRMHHKPNELSGGQRQRVGVARALAADPPLLLLDEPFGSLDPVTRAELRREFAALADRLGKAVVFVTHDVREGLLLGGRIGLLAGGRLVFHGTEAEFRRSEHPEAGAFLRSADPGASPRGSP